MNRFNFLKGVVLLMALALTTSCEKVKDAWNDVHIEDGLAGYYTFDDGTANDMSSNKFNAVLIGSPSFVSETANGTGKALFFSTPEQYMSIPYNSFVGIVDFSATMWVKDFAVGSFLDVSVEDSRSRFKFYYDEDGFFKFRLNPYDSGLGQFVYDARSLRDGRWHMLALVRKGAVCELYVDGQLVAKDERRYHDAPEEPSLIVKNIMKFDNLRIYNRAISAKEVKAIYDKEK